MKKIVVSATILSCVLGLGLSSTFTTRAQNREKFVISARAGGVNAVSGRAEVKSTPGADWQLLSVTDDLKSGDTVKTSDDGRLEVLLNPGSYLRIGENSEFQLADSSLDNLEVKLLRGTAIVEATGAEETQLAIGITTPHARMTIVRRGLYRVNVVPGDATELFVRKGRVLLGSSQTKVKDGYKVIFKNSEFTVAKLEKADKDKDYFDDWSKDRANLVAQASRHLKMRDVNSFLSSDWSWRLGPSRRFGLWYYNARTSCYTFLPFYLGWGSPYGLSYSSVYDCGCYPRYYPRPSYLPGSTGIGSGSGTGITRSNPPIGTGSSPSGIDRRSSASTGTQTMAAPQMPRDTGSTRTTVVAPPNH